MPSQSWPCRELSCREEEEEEEVTDRPEGPGREEKGREGNGDLFGHGRDEEGSHNSRCSTVTRTNTQGKGTEGRPPPKKKKAPWQGRMNTGRVCACSGGCPIVNSRAAGGR